MFMFN